MSEEKNLKQNYRAKEAAVYTGLALSTVWLYARQGRLNPIRLSPRVTVFKKDDLDDLISRSEGKA